MNSLKFFSHHIFLFAFHWERWQVRKSETWTKRFDLEKVADELDFLSNNAEPQERKWKREEYKLSGPDQYNEYNYLYGFAREVSYDLGEMLDTSTTRINDTLIHHYRYQHPKEWHYNVDVRDQKVYSLEIDSILLNLYSTGTGVMSFHLRNRKYSNKEDILRINQFGRRLIPPFLDIEPEGVVTGNDDTRILNGKFSQCLLQTKTHELANSIWLGKPGVEPEESFYEDWERYKSPSTYERGPFSLPGFISGLFGNSIITQEADGFKNKDYQKRKLSQKKVYMRPAMDDRMFVISWYGNNKLAAKVKRLPQSVKTGRFSIWGNFYRNKNVQPQYGYLSDEAASDWWYKYLFVDGNSLSCDDDEMKQRLLRDHTYSRWVKGYGTLYGCSRYSMVMLTSEYCEHNAHLIRHLQTMYYKLTELCLLQRATVLRFSDEITHYSNPFDRTIGKKRRMQRIRELYQHYILFVNKIYFREVTAQEQGIEIYDLLQKHMRIERDVKDLDWEIDELHGYVSMVVDRSQSREIGMLSWAATILLPATVVAGIFGMNTLPGTSTVSDDLASGTIHWPFIWSLILVGTLTVIVFFSLLLHRSIINRRS